MNSLVGGWFFLVSCWSGLRTSAPPISPPLPTARDYVSFHAELMIEETLEILDEFKEPGQENVERHPYRVHRTPTPGGWQEDVIELKPGGELIYSRAEYFLNTTLGYGLRSWGPPGKEEVYTNPKVILPAQLSPSTWENFHGTSRGTSRRLCKLVPETTSCADGLAVSCQSWMPGYQIVLLREHFCRDVGWIGSEGRVLEVVSTTCQPVLSSRYVLKAVDGRDVENPNKETGWPDALEGCSRGTPP